MDIRLHLRLVGGQCLAGLHVQGLRGLNAAARGLQVARGGLHVDAGRLLARLRNIQAGCLQAQGLGAQGLTCCLQEAIGRYTQRLSAGGVARGPRFEAAVCAHACSPDRGAAGQDLRCSAACVCACVFGLNLHAAQRGHNAAVGLAGLGLQLDVAVAVDRAALNHGALGLDGHITP